MTSISNESAHMQIIKSVNENFKCQISWCWISYNYIQNFM